MADNKERLEKLKKQYEEQKSLSIKLEERIAMYTKELESVQKEIEELGLNELQLEELITNLESDIEKELSNAEK